MDILGISEDKISPISLQLECQFYGAAFEFYENGNYREATKLFTQLVLTDPYSENYWRGLASSKQMVKDYQASLHGWSMVALFQENDPLPHFHAAECCLALDDKEDALKALDAALSLCGKDDSLNEKINLLKMIHYVKC